MSFRFYFVKKLTEITHRPLSYDAMLGVTSNLGATVNSLLSTIPMSILRDYLPVIYGFITNSKILILNRISFHELFAITATTMAMLLKLAYCVAFIINTLRFFNIRINT